MTTSKAAAQTATDILANPPAVGGLLAEEHVTVLMVGIGQRLNRGAAAYYRAAYDIGMAEWRVLLVLSRTQSLNVGELSSAADLDKAAVSRTLALLDERKLVQVKQTRTRGRAAIARLTPEGAKFCATLHKVSKERHRQLFADFSREEEEQLRSLLKRVALALDSEGWR